MSMTNEDIYEYQFTSLFKYVKSLIGRDTIKVYETLEEELDRFLACGNAAIMVWDVDSANNTK